MTMYMTIPFLSQKTNQVYTFKVCWSEYYEEYRVRQFINNKEQINLEYYTDNYEDACMSANEMRKHYEESEVR